jgi:hypothetical protein
MSTSGDSLAASVQSSYRKLSTVASELNFVSDELGKYVSEMDAALKKLNLGVEVWVDIKRDQDDRCFSSESLGYQKIGGKWGIALRTISGMHGSEDDSDVEIWLFNEAPRSLRITSIAKVPELLEKLSVEAKKMIDEIDGNLARVKEVAEVIKKTSEEPVKRIVARGSSAKPMTLGGPVAQELKK